MRKLSFSILLILTALSIATFAQTKKLRWDSGCEHEGNYDSKKHTAVQLKNTLRLRGNYFRLDFTTATIWKYEEIEWLNFAPIEAEYQKKSVELKNLNIVKVPYWEDIRQLKLKEMEQYYWLIKTTMASYKTPESLRQYPYAESCKSKYAEPLIAGGESLLKIWEMVNVDSRQNNIDQARLKRIFDEKRASADALKFAVVEVTGFGWWNCANGQIDQGDNYAILEKNFNNLFTRIRTIRCDEP